MSFTGWRALACALLTYGACAHAADAPPAAKVDAAGATDRAGYKTALDDAAAAYRRHRATCRPLHGNDAALCMAEGKAEARRAEAAAEAAFRNTPRARVDAKVAAANADYSVDKTRCNAQRGNDRRSCAKDAKERQSAAITAALRAQ